MLSLLVAAAAFNAPMGSSFVALSSRVSTPVMNEVPFWEREDWQAQQAGKPIKAVRKPIAKKAAPSLRMAQAPPQKKVVAPKRAAPPKKAAPRPAPKPIAKKGKVVPVPATVMGAVGGCEGGCEGIFFLRR